MRKKRRHYQRRQKNPKGPLRERMRNEPGPSSEYPRVPLGGGAGTIVGEGTPPIMKVDSWDPYQEHSNEGE